MTASLPLDVVLPAVEATLRDGAAFDDELETVLCGVGCGQPLRGDGVAGIRARWVDVVRRAQDPAAAPVTSFTAVHLAEEYATARLVDGDTAPGPHIHEA